MSASIQGIVFDKDGTLFDFRNTWEAWAAAFLGDLGETPEHAAALGQAIGFDLERRCFSASSVAIAGTPFDIARALLPNLPDWHEHDLVALMNQKAIQAPQAEAVPLAPLLSGLKAQGFWLGVATNDGEDPARAHLATAGVLDIFDFVAGSDSGFGGKPAAGQLVAFADRFGLAPELCVMVGDSRHDLMAGRRAGFATLGVLTGLADENDLADLADAVVPDIGHLPRWLAQG